MAKSCGGNPALHSESDLERHCKKLAEAKGFKLYKWVSPGTTGLPDRILVRDDGTVTFVEFKHPNGTGRLSPMQNRRIDELLARGQDVAVVDSIAKFDEINRSKT